MGIFAAAVMAVFAVVFYAAPHGASGGGPTISPPIVGSPSSAVCGASGGGPTRTTLC